MSIEIDGRWLVTTTEAATMLDKSQATVRLRLLRHTQAGWDTPEPAGSIAGSDVYWLDDIALWMRQRPTKRKATALSLDTSGR